MEGRSIDTLQRVLACTIVCFLISLSTAAIADDATKFEGDPRFDKLIVEVMLDEPGIKAREKAMETAQENGLQLWLDTQMDHLEESTRALFVQHTGDYIVGSAVLEERAVGLQRELDVVVFVDREKLRYDIASYLFPRLVEKPTIVILIGEEYAGTSGYTVSQDGFATQMLARFYADQGFRVVSAEEINAHFNENDLLTCLRSGNKAGGLLGRTLKADIVLLGETRTEPENDPPLGTLKARAYADVMVVRAADGVKLERVSAEAAVAGTDVATASKRATEDAVYKIQQPSLVAAALGTIEAPPKEYTRLIVRSRNIRQAQSAVGRFLKSRPLLSDVTLLHAGRDELIYDVTTTDGKLGELVRDVQDSTDRHFWLVPVQVVEDKMVFDLVTR